MTLTPKQLECLEAHTLYCERGHRVDKCPFGMLRGLSFEARRAIFVQLETGEARELFEMARLDGCQTADEIGEESFGPRRVPHPLAELCSTEGR
jgi:hypothetical protein